MKVRFRVRFLGPDSASRAGQDGAEHGGNTTGQPGRLRQQSGARVGGLGGVLQQADVTLARGTGTREKIDFQVSEEEMPRPSRGLNRGPDPGRLAE